MVELWLLRCAFHLIASYRQRTCEVNSLFGFGDVFRTKSRVNIKSVNSKGRIIALARSTYPDRLLFTTEK